jgi:type I restriction enzyme M protein
MGRMVDRTHRELTPEEITRIAGTYHAWRGDSLQSPLPSVGEGQGEGAYRDIPGFCKAATLGDIRPHGHVLTPGRYVGAEAQEDDGEPFEEKMQRLTAQLAAQMAESARLDDQIRKNLEGLGYGF